MPLSISLGLSRCERLIQCLNLILKNQVEITLNKSFVLLTFVMAQEKPPGNCCILASGSAGARTTIGSLEATIPFGDGDRTWISFIRLWFRFLLNRNANHCTGRWLKIKGRVWKNTHSLLVLMPWTRGTTHTAQSAPKLGYGNNPVPAISRGLRSHLQEGAKCDIRNVSNGILETKGRGEFGVFVRWTLWNGNEI